jgi:hypothetical protein
VPATVPCARIPGVNIVCKFKLFVRALETRRKASFSGLFRNEYMYKSVAYLLTMHVYCVYHEMSKSPNNILFLENSRNKRPSNHFLTVSSVKSTRIPLLFLTVAYVSENIKRTNYQYAIVSWDISRHVIVYQSADRGTQFHVGHYFILHNTRQGRS